MKRGGGGGGGGGGGVKVVHARSDSIHDLKVRRQFHKTVANILLQVFCLYDGS